MPVKNGIYCLETNWTTSLKDKNSVRPILEIIEKQTGCKHIYHNCATREELVFMLKKWKTKAISGSYPIVYFGFHGHKGRIKLNDDPKGMTLEELGEILEGACHNKILFFASCETLNVPETRIQQFLKLTGALAAIGYKSTVDWMMATAFELLVLDKLRQGLFDTRGMAEMKTDIETEYKSLKAKLKFIIVINQKHYPRRRQ